MFRIEVKKKDNIEGDKLKKDIFDLGINVQSVEVIYTYLIFGNLTKIDVQRIAQDLLADKVWETYKINPKRQMLNAKCFTIEVAYNPGVMDAVAISVVKGMQDLGIKGVEAVKTAKKYLITGALSKQELEFVADKLLVNRTIQHIVRNEEYIVTTPKYSFKLVSVDLLTASDKDLLNISKRGMLGLNLIEMKAIQKHFMKLARNPTDVELETIAQTWSEHCVHKTFKSMIEFNGKLIPPLIDTIMQVTNELSPSWCVSVFKDNAGIIKFGDGYNICFKVETHNHPSALEPYGGAGTGIGGVIRDPLGTGLGAKPILNTDVFCFGPPDYPHKRLPPGTLHPLRIMKGVVAGVRDYGNKMGIPTANGAVLFDDRYIGNPVVYCGTVGLIPDDKCKKEVVCGDLIVLVGGRTGRDGIHGVTFASIELTKESEEISSGAVQIGNPITEKKLVDILLKARDRGLYRAITDCGGGGLSSAIGELAHSTGAIVDLDKVPLKYEGLSYSEIWISEAQERMIIFVPPKKLAELLELCRSEDVEATVIGEVTDDKTLILRYEGNVVGKLDMKFLHEGLPLPIKYASWKPKKFNEPKYIEPKDLTPYLLCILSSLNVCSKEWVIRQYDHEVQGGSVCKPLVGYDGPGDACIVRPLLNSNRGIVIGCGINPKYGDPELDSGDPYWMAGSNIDEAIRNVVAVGANPKRVAILDNFSWGNPDKPDRLGELVRAVQGCYDIAKAYKLPFISGKDSLNNEYKIGKRSISIPPTLLISAIGIIEDINKAVSMDLKASNDLIYIIGKTYNELGGSHYYEIRSFVSNCVPKVRPKPSLFSALHNAIKTGLVKACHDCSEGGIGVTCAEMCFAGGIGMKVWLNKVICGETITKNDQILFSESNSRFIVEVARENKSEFASMLSEIDFAEIGITTNRDELEIFGLNGKPIVKSKISALKSAWQKPLRLQRIEHKKQEAIGTEPVHCKGGVTPSIRKYSKTRTLILRTAGTNCDIETKVAFEVVGARSSRPYIVDLVHINELIRHKKSLNDYDILVIPGGFTYGDDISAGKILANELRFKLGEDVDKFVTSGKLILGICNGFQVLVKLGLLPYGKLGEQVITLTNNVSGLFQCEWVALEAPKTNCIFTKGIDEIELPIAHAEGRFVAQPSIIKELNKNRQVALRYKGYNPNGSMDNIAGICDTSGRIFGLMPHPERFIFETQYPRWTRAKKEPQGLIIFRNAVEYIQ
ncbi:MAG: phosphoribosylformylglycinamidine synthase subunit PurL [bacterium]|nr:phosphoribosylformylglycinamidine synthase subunit PurL [bacterium]